MDIWALRGNGGMRKTESKARHKKGQMKLVDIRRRKF